MAKQNSREMLLKLSNGDSPETFATVCGLNSKTLTINDTEVDNTTADCTTPSSTLWRQIKAGTKSVSVSGSGIFTDSAAETALLTLKMGATAIDNFQVVVPDLGTFEGAFLLSELAYAGEDTEGNVTYNLTLASNGAVTFTAA